MTRLGQVAGGWARTVAATQPSQRPAGPATPAGSRARAPDRSGYRGTVPAAEKASSPVFEAFAADVLTRYPQVSRGSLFGMPCLTIGGKAFAGSYAGAAGR